MGQIIDFRAMINEATKLNNEDTGANSDPAVNPFNIIWFSN